MSESPMLTPEALDAMRWMQPQADAAAFLAAQDREALTKAVCQRLYGYSLPTNDLTWHKTRAVIDALLP